MDEREAEMWRSIVRDRMATMIFKAASAEMRAKIKFYEDGIEAYLVMCRRLQAENEWYMEEIARVEAETRRIEAETRRIEAGLSDTASAAGGRRGKRGGG